MKHHYLIINLWFLLFQVVEAVETEQIVEEEEEIGYIQSLILQVPALTKVTSFYQEIKIHESTHYGKVFILDNCLQLTERDAPHYNEMLAHVPMMEYLANKGPGSDQLKVLVLGGGDGYVVSELLKYPFIQSIDHVELDEEVINVSKNYFPWAKDLWQDERVNLVITDGAAFVKEKASQADTYYNVIIQDASDPFFMEPDGTFKILPSHVLYTNTHFEMMHKLLEPMKGVLMFQAETYNIPSNLQEIKKWRSNLSNIGFEKVRYGSIAIGTYPTGQIGFMVAHASKNEQEEMVCKDTGTCEDANNATDAMNMMEWLDWNAIGQHFKALPDKTKYYHPRVHRRWGIALAQISLCKISLLLTNSLMLNSSFDLPLWVEEYLY